MKVRDSGGSEFAQAPIGSHVARCFRIVDLGTQREEYQGNVGLRRKVVVGWELPTELMETGEFAGKPFTVSKFYTASLNEKANLRKDLENWRGRTFSEVELAGFDLKAILGKPCLLSVIHNDKAKARVAGVMAVPKGMAVPAQVNPASYFDLDEFSQADFDALPEGFKKFVQASPEYGQIKNGAPHDPNWVPGDEPADADGDIPF